jgi:tRNA threonylcarbamoyladenosine modification (KEOPS) complex  Pcc1 subunit
MEREKPKAGSHKNHIRLVVPKDPKINYKRLLNNQTNHERSNTAIKEQKETLIIEITAKDLTALRASANSILRDLQVIEATKALK